MRSAIALEPACYFCIQMAGPVQVQPFSSGAVRGFLHPPAGRGAGGLVLAHGAGGNARMPLLVALAEAFAAEGFSVLRIDLPFRQKRPHGPPSPSGASADRTGLKAAADAMRNIASGRVILGGQSYGGRQASMLAAEDPSAADALLLLSYPLHPPGKPERPRTAHFPSLRIPLLFVHGSRDPFASSEELQAAAGLIPARHMISEVENAGHELANGKFDIHRLVLDPCMALIAEATEATSRPEPEGGE